MFGQVVIGPPGSGKSTYCYGMYQFLSAIGRKACVVNLDPANETQSYPIALDVRDYLTVDDIMEDLNLGPNGALVYAMEHMEEESLDTFIQEVKKLAEQQNYILFDCAGQVELFTHHTSLHDIFARLVKLDLRLCCVNLVDCLYITSPAQYISVLLLCLRSMLNMDMPHLNVLSKIDKLAAYGKLPMRLEYYTEAHDLSYLQSHLEQEFKNSPLSRNYIRLTEAIGDLIEDFGLVSFEVLSVENKKSMIHLLSAIDKANGYSFGTSEIGGDSIWSEATRAGGVEEIDIHERWIDYKQQYDDEEQRQYEEATRGLDENPELTEDEKWELEVQEWERKRGANSMKR